MEVWPEVVLEVDLDLGSEEGFEMVESVGVDAVNKAMLIIVINKLQLTDGNKFKNQFYIFLNKYKVDIETRNTHKEVNSK